MVPILWSLFGTLLKMRQGQRFRAFRHRKHGMHQRYTNSFFPIFQTTICSPILCNSTLHPKMSNYCIITWTTTSLTLWDIYGYADWTTPGKYVPMAHHWLPLVLFVQSKSPVQEPDTWAHLKKKVYTLLLSSLLWVSTTEL